MYQAFVYDANFGILRTGGLDSREFPKLGRDGLGEEGIFSVCPLALVLPVLLVGVVPPGILFWASSYLLTHQTGVS